MTIFSSIGHAFEDAGNTITKGFSDIGNGLSDTGDFLLQNVGNVYSDAKSIVSYTGKHLIGDVDGIASMLSSPLIYFAIGGVLLIMLLK